MEIDVPFISDVTDCVNCDVISDLEEVVDNVDGVTVEEGCWDTSGLGVVVRVEAGVGGDCVTDVGVGSGSKIVVTVVIVDVDEVSKN